jgi:hypothetical protein
LAAARGKNLRQVERLVAGHDKGDTPDDDVNPDLFDCIIQWKLPAPVAALLRETRKHLNDEVGDNLEDAQLVEILCRRALEPAFEGVAQTSSESATAACVRPVTDDPHHDVSKLSGGVTSRWRPAHSDQRNRARARILRRDIRRR